MLWVNYDKREDGRESRKKEYIFHDNSIKFGIMQTGESSQGEAEETEVSPAGY